MTIHRYIIIQYTLLQAHLIVQMHQGYLIVLQDTPSTSYFMDRDSNTTSDSKNYYFFSNTHIFHIFMI